MSISKLTQHLETTWGHSSVMSKYVEKETKMGYLILLNSNSFSAINSKPILEYIFIN